MSKDTVDSFKRWGIAFIIGGVLGAYAGEQRFMYFVKKDCEVLGMFRFGDTAYGCQVSKK